MSLELRVPLAFVQSTAVPKRCFVTGEETQVSALALPMCTYLRRAYYPEIPYTISMMVGEAGRARWEQIQPKPFRQMALTAVVVLPLLIGAVFLSDIPELMGTMIAASVCFTLGQMFFYQYRLSTVAKVWWEGSPDQLRLQFPSNQAAPYEAWKVAYEQWKIANG